MMNYAFNVSQSETEKWFECIYNNNNNNNNNNNAHEKYNNNNKGNFHANRLCHGPTHKIEESNILLTRDDSS